MGQVDRRARREWTAVLAAFALLVQLLVPGAAAAAAGASGGLVVGLCSVEGRLSLAADQQPVKPHGFGGLHCPDCVSAATAAVLPAPAPAVQPVAYARPLLFAPAAQARPQQARAPPKPPATGPPATV